MAKKKKGIGESLRNQVEQIPVTRQKAPRTISTNVSTGGIGSSLKTATQKAEEERSARMRQGLSSIVRASFNNQRRLQPTRVQKNLFQNLGNALQPVKNSASATKTGGQGVGNYGFKTSVRRTLAPVKQDIRENPYDAVRTVGMKGSRNERKVYRPMWQRDEEGQVSSNQRRLENAARGGNRKAQVEAEMGRTKAQTVGGRTYDQFINAELNRQGLLGQDYLLRSKDPSKEAMEYRKRYGFDKEALDRVLAIANNTPASGDYNKRFSGQDNGSAVDRIRFGLDESYRARNIEDTLRRQYGVELTPEQQERLDAVRSSGGYMVGNMVGQMSQYALTRGALSGLGMVGRGAKAAETGLKALRNEMIIDQAASVPLNMLDAMKEDNLEGVVKRFGLNQTMDFFFGIITEGFSIARNPLYRSAKAKHNAAKEALESGDTAAATAIEQSAKRDIDAIPKEELTQTQNEIINRQGVVELVQEEPYNISGGVDNGAEQLEPRNAREIGGAEEVRADVGTVQNGERQATGRAYLEDATDSASTGRTGRTLSLTNEQRAVMDAAGKTNANLREADYSAFSNALNEGKASNKYGSYVDPQDVNELTKKGAKTFLSDDGSVGFAVTKDGDMIGAFNRGGKYRGAVDDMLITARLNGGTKLDCYGAGLVNKYEQAGYVPVARIPFNPEYVDDPLLLANKPDVYVMMKNSDDIDTVIRKNANGEYHLSTQDELDNLRSFDDYDEALNYRDDLLKQQESPASAEKSDKEKLFYNAPNPYTPKGGGKDEKAWKAIRKSYEKDSEEKLLQKKQAIKKAVNNNKIPKSEGDERIKLIDNILEQREYYRYGTKKEFGDKKISQTVDTGRAAENIPDAVKAKIEDDVVAGEAGIKNGQNPKVALRSAKDRVKEDPDAVRIKIDKATPSARDGKLPTGYDNLQEYYADATALLDHYSKKISDMESKGLENSAEYKKAIDDTANYIEGVFSVRSQEGYAAVQYNMMVRSNPEVRIAVVERSLRKIEDEYANELEKIAKKNGTEISGDQIHITLSKESKKALREVNPDNPLDMAMTLHKISVETWNQVPADRHEVADAIRKTSMLLNPKTHLRNVIGNTLMIPARIMKDLLGAPIERWAIRKGYMRADQATKAVVNRFSREDKPYYDVAKAVWKEWKDVIRGDAKMFDNIPSSSSKLIGKRPIGEGRVLTAGIENPSAWRRSVDWIIKKNGSALEKSDALMMRLHFTDSFSQVCKARGLDPNKLTKEQLMEVIDAATGEAQRATFRDASEVAKTINGWKTYKKGDTFVQKVGRFSVNTTMPFVNTPINILRRSWDYSPAGLIHGGGEILQGIQKHNAKQVKKGIDRMCSGLTGSGVCLLGFYLGRSGDLTARLSEGSEGYYEQDQGFQEYSLNIGGDDGWSVSLSQFAPHTIPLFMGVELASMFDPNEDVNWKALPDVIGRVFDPSMDMSVMQGPMSVLKSISESKSLGDVPLVAALTIGTNYISQYIPTLSGQIARTIDPVRRDTSSTQENNTLNQVEKAWNKTKAKIPLASQTLEPYQDVWGREQVSFDNPMQRLLYETVSPSYVRKKNVTPLDKEITRLNGITADDEDKIIPRKFFGGTVGFNGGEIQISKSDLTTYNRARGKAAYEAASKLIDTDAYKNASDAEKRKMLNNVFKDANTKGKQETLLKKGYSAKKVYTDDFDGGKLENADNAFNAGVAPKHYYELMTDKSVDLDGNGSKTQYEVYTYLQNTDLTDAQKAAIWNSYNKGWKNNPYAGGYIPTADSGSKSSSGNSKRSRSGRRYSGGRSGKVKARAKTASEKKFSSLQKMQAPTTGKGITALSQSAKGLSSSQKKALVKMMQKKLDV